MYTKKSWANGDNVTPEDFNRIEEGIATNDTAITDMKDETKDGSLAKKIAENTKQINVLNQGVSTLGSKIKKTVLNLSTMADEVMLKSIVSVASGSSVFPKLPVCYAGIVSVYSAIKGEYYCSYFVQITNKYAYHTEKLCENRFNNTADEINIEFATVADTDCVILTLRNNTALDGEFFISLTQNLRG